MHTCFKSLKARLWPSQARVIYLQGIAVPKLQALAACAERSENWQAPPFDNPPPEGLHAYLPVLVAPRFFTKPKTTNAVVCVCFTWTVQPFGLFRQASISFVRKAGNYELPPESIIERVCGLLGFSGRKENWLLEPCGEETRQLVMAVQPVTLWSKDGQVH